MRNEERISRQRRLLEWARSVKLLFGSAKFKMSRCFPRSPWEMKHREAKKLRDEHLVKSSNEILDLQDTKRYRAFERRQLEKRHRKEDEKAARPWLDLDWLLGPPSNVDAHYVKASGGKSLSKVVWIFQENFVDVVDFQEKVRHLRWLQNLPDADTRDVNQARYEVLLKCNADPHSCLEDRVRTAIDNVPVDSVDTFEYNRCNV